MFQKICKFETKEKNMVDKCFAQNCEALNEIFFGKLQVNRDGWSWKYIKQVLQPAERQIILNVCIQTWRKYEEGVKKADVVVAIADITRIGSASIGGNKEEEVELPKKRQRISIFNKLDEWDWSGGDKEKGASDLSWWTTS